MRCVAILAFTIALTGCQIGTPKTRDVETFVKAMEGDWRGEYHLWLMPGSPKQSSPSTAQVKAGEMSYDWAQDKTAHKGKFRFGGSGRKAQFDWQDTFHTPGAGMKGEGALSEDGTKLVFMTSYGAANAPSWGWRTELTLSAAGTLTMEAYNITPQGQEALAVRCEYARN